MKTNVWWTLICFCFICRGMCGSLVWRHYLIRCVFMFIDTGSSSTDDQQKSSDDLRKDASELGIEVIDHISTVAGSWWLLNVYNGWYVWQMFTCLCCYKYLSTKMNLWTNGMCVCRYPAGLKAKEKREKEKSSASSRPPTRRGGHSADQSVPAPSSHAASSYLCHPQLPSQCFVGWLLQCVSWCHFQPSIVADFRLPSDFVSEHSAIVRCDGDSDEIRSCVNTTQNANQHSSHIPNPFKFLFPRSVCISLVVSKVINRCL